MQDNLEFIGLKLNGCDVAFQEVPLDATNIRVVLSEDLNTTEVVFDDSTSYCLHVDAPMYRGIYELKCELMIGNKRYLLLIKVKNPEPKNSKRIRKKK